MISKIFIEFMIFDKTIDFIKVLISKIFIEFMISKIIYDDNIFYESYDR
jgi:hypothetical protein